MTSQRTLLGVSGERYMIDKELQKGSNGKVFSGLRISDGATVAIKCLFKDFEPGQLPQEVRNCMLLQVTDVTGIVNMLDYCVEETSEDSRKIAIVFEFMPLDLYNYMNEYGVKEVHVKRIVKTVIKTLLSMHSKAKRMHMDIKEENVLIDPETFEVKLCDFDSLASTYRLMTKRVGGTIPCLAPETVKKGQFFPTRSVTWNVGIMTYSLLNDLYRPWDIYKNQDVSKLVYDSEVSTLGKDFVASCLIKNVLCRPDLIMLLDNPWFNDDSDVEFTDDSDVELNE
ncbi:serine/threonine-protein kinase pim-2-like [Mercenaria mercenaria]|uniref:serine/threonine-protein kinase pim-2-like n=1 Tax=Mercenaria mercenaria TaxID=6596 RepID=UPI00234E6958|nr:serine/threonine-protein kinase pim-2-like [Mercenaria mercenaria]